MFEKPKFLVKLCRDIKGVYHPIKILKSRVPTQDTVRFNKNTYVIDHSNPLEMVKKNIPCYYFDIDTGQQLSVKEGFAINPKTLDVIISRKVVSAISADLNESQFRLEMKNLILGILIGSGIVGFVLMILIYVGVF